MKHLLSIVLSSLYLLASVGIVVNSHYCGGRLSSIEVFTAKADCCCGMSDKMDHCCDDELALFQLDEDQQINSQIFLDLTYIGVPVITDVSEMVKWEQPAEKEFNVEQFDLPPPGPPIWLKNCALTYYG